MKTNDKKALLQQLRTTFVRWTLAVSAHHPEKTADTFDQLVFFSFFTKKLIFKYITYKFLSVLATS
ncbi:MAG: hypothetical protein ACK4NN_08965 [Rheinheimera sp.]